MIPRKPVTMSEEMDDEQQQQEDSEEEEDDDDGLPSYEFRFESAKMLLELEDTTETAIQVGAVAKGAQVSACCCIRWYG